MTCDISFGSILLSTQKIWVSAISVSAGPFRGEAIRAIWNGPQAFGAPKCLEFNIRYYVISVIPIIKQQEKILKSLVEVAENLNLKPEQAIELSSIKNSLKWS